MTDEVTLRDGRLSVRGTLSWPADCPVPAERAVASVWERIATLQSTKLACGCVASELNVDPVILLAAVGEEQSARRKRELPPDTEPTQTSIASMFASPDGTLVRISGDAFGLRRRVTNRGKTWVTFALGQGEDYVEVTVFPDVFEACGGTFITDDIALIVEGRKWFTERTDIIATNVIPQTSSSRDTFNSSSQDQRSAMDAICPAQRKSTAAMHEPAWQPFMAAYAMYLNSRQWHRDLADFYGLRYAVYCELTGIDPMEPVGGTQNELAQRILEQFANGDGHLRSPFSGLLAGPRPLIEVVQNHEPRIQASIDQQRQNYLEAMADLATMLWGTCPAAVTDDQLATRGVGAADEPDRARYL